MLLVIKIIKPESFGELALSAVDLAHFLIALNLIQTASFKHFRRLFNSAFHIVFADLRNGFLQRLVVTERDWLDQCLKVVELPLLEVV